MACVSSLRPGTETLFPCLLSGHIHVQVSPPLGRDAECVSAHKSGRDSRECWVGRADVGQKV